MSRVKERALVRWLQLFPLVVAIAIGIFVRDALGQSPGKSVRDRLADSLAKLDPTKPEQYASDADSIRGSMQKETDELLCNVADCYLALGSGDRSALRDVLRHLTRQWNKIPEEVQPTVLRLSLVEAIDSRAEKRAEKIYKEMTQFCLRDGVALASRRESIALIGFLNGLFEGDEGPLSAEVRAQAESRLSLAKDTGPAYAIGRQKGSEHRVFLEKQKSAWEKLESDERVSQMEQDQSEWEESRADYESMLRETQTENADQQEVWRRTFEIRKRLAGYLDEVIQDSYWPTPSHPGYPPVEPAVPDRSRVRVNEYEEKMEKRGDKWVEVKERRSKSDIDREKDQKLAEWQTRYRIEKPIYDDKKAVYERELQAWLMLDFVRRKELFELYSDLSERIEQIDNEKQSRDRSKKEAMQKIKRLGDSIKELRNKMRAWQQLDEGVRLGEDNYFVRASLWEGIDRQLELQHLLRWIRKDP